MGTLTYYCEGCPRITEEYTCPVYEDTSWVERRCGCPLYKQGTIFAGQQKKIRAGQQKSGRRKQIGDYDLTQGGLFPDWGGIGAGWKAKVELSKKVGNFTPGREKAHGTADWLARYCARYSRARFHRNYGSQVLKWRRINREIA